MTATQEEISPYLKKHDQSTICFADTVTQVSNALKRTNLGTEAKPEELEGSHLMLFGVEDWSASKAKNLAVDFRDPKNTFTRLEIFGCDIKEDAQKELAAGFKPENMGNVTQFDLDNTQLTPGGAAAIFENIAECDKIKKINLQGSIPSKQVMKAIEEKITEKCNLMGSLEHLDLKINDLKEDSAEHIGALMTRFENPVHLDLFYNALKTPGAQSIGAALGMNARLVHLDLCCNDIGDDGAIAIGEGLKNNTHLEVLKLALNNIGNRGGMAIMAALAPVAVGNSALRNRSLRILDLSANVMKEEADMAMTEDEKDQDKLLDELANKEDPLMRLRDESYDKPEVLEKIEAELAEINNTRNVILKHGMSYQIRPFQTQLVEVWTQANEGQNNLEEFDFTGVEFDKKGWSALALHLAKLRKIEGKDFCKIKFSIVDLMSKENLEILEPAIWKTKEENKETFIYKDFPCIDWRRLPKEDEAAATN